MDVQRAALATPGLDVIFALAATTFCIVQFIRTKRRVAKLKKGRDGEREVAEVLDEFKQFGASVLHDIPGKGGNIDHVVTCSRGIFVIETKNWSKPKDVWEMDFDGEQMIIPPHGRQGFQSIVDTHSS